MPSPSKSETDVRKRAIPRSPCGPAAEGSRPLRRESVRYLRFDQTGRRPSNVNPLVAIHVGKECPIFHPNPSRNAPLDRSARSCRNEVTSVPHRLPWSRMLKSRSLEPLLSRSPTYIFEAGSRSSSIAAKRDGPAEPKRGVGAGETDRAMFRRPFPVLSEQVIATVAVEIADTGWKSSLHSAKGAESLTTGCITSLPSALPSATATWSIVAPLWFQTTSPRPSPSRRGATRYGDRPAPP